MDTQSRIVIAFIFIRSGKETLTESEIKLTLSIDLSWFNQHDAEAFVKRSIENNLLEKKEEGYSPTFNIKEIIIPFGFKPTIQPLEEKTTLSEDKQEVSLLKKLIDKISEKTNQDKNIIQQHISGLHKQKNITEEVAAILIAKDNDFDLKEQYDEIENEIFKEGNEE